MSSQGLEFFGAQDTPDIRSLDTIAAFRIHLSGGLTALSLSPGGYTVSGHLGRAVNKNRVSPIVAMFGSRVPWRLPVVFGSDDPATKVDYAKGAAGCNRLESPALAKFRASCGAADMAGFALIA